MCHHEACVETLKCKNDEDCANYPTLKRLRKNFTCAPDIQTNQNFCYATCSDQSECGIHQLCLRKEVKEVANLS